MNMIDNDMESAKRHAYTIQQLQQYANEGLTQLIDLQDTTRILEEGIRWFNSCVLSFEHNFFTYDVLLDLMNWFVEWMEILLNTITLSDQLSTSDHHALNKLELIIREIDDERTRMGTDQLDPGQLWTYLENGLEEIIHLEDIALVQRKGVDWMKQLIQSGRVKIVDEQGNPVARLLDEEDVVPLLEYYSVWCKGVMGLDDEDEDEDDENNNFDTENDINDNGGDQMHMMITRDSSQASPFGDSSFSTHHAHKSRPSIHGRSSTGRHYSNNNTNTSDQQQLHHQSIYHPETIPSTHSNNFTAYQHGNNGDSYSWTSSRTERNRHAQHDMLNSYSAIEHSRSHKSNSQFNPHQRSQSYNTQSSSQHSHTRNNFHA